MLPRCRNWARHKKKDGKKPSPKNTLVCILLRFFYNGSVEPKTFLSASAQSFARTLKIKLIAAYCRVN